ncbi:VWA domain-containing protein [bacterium]|nr:VWA domain-containing protein [bacterium]
MRPMRLLLNVVPPPRQPVMWLRVLPLVVFLVLFLGGCLWLEVAHVVTFAWPTAFAFVLLAPWLWWMHLAGYSGLRGVRALAALAVRFAVLAAFITALAEPRAVRLSNVLSVVYTLDLSDSIGHAAMEQALGYVLRTATDRPPANARDEAGLVVFGRHAAVELPPRMTLALEEKVIASQLPRDGTNIEKGLALAAAMIPHDRQGRIVLVSDGAATEGSLSRTLDELKARAIPVDVLPVRYDHRDEVWLEKLELPRIVRAGETYQATVILSSLAKGTGTLTLRENGQLIATERVEFAAGKNRFDLSLYLRKPGFYEYVAAIEVPPGKDGWAQNNLAVNHLYLKGKGRLLVVTDPSGRPEDWARLVAALQTAERQVDRITAHRFPREAFSVMPYDAVVFVNVAADAFDAPQLQALHDAVYHQGCGFLMVGGRNSFGPGGYQRTPIEQALPVTMDVTQKKVLPKGALVICLHTCEFDEGNTWGKRIAKEAVRVLSARDDVGILVYDWQGGEKWLFPLTPAGEYDSLVPKINQARIGDMPSFATTMKMGLDALTASDAGMKHMIIISDGDPSPPPPAVLRGFREQEISVSTVAIFPHDETGGDATRLMRLIAKDTGGRFYEPQDPRRLPSIFVKEAKTLRRSMIQNKDFVPLVHAPGPAIKGIGALPPLHGLVLTTAKPRATTVLRVPDTDDVDPVLATWRYGIGKTAAFTSDLSANWGADWVASPHYEPFVRQLITDIARSARAEHLRLRTVVEGGRGSIRVEDFHPDPSFMDLRAQVAGPRGRTETVALKQEGPRRYRGDFALWGHGHYHIMASGAGPGRDERAIGRFAVPYSPEYLRFRSNPLALQAIAERTGGRMLAGDETGADLFVKDPTPRMSSQSAVDWFLLALAILIPLDVAVRRVQLDWLVVRGWLGLGRKRQQSGATLGALLHRKEQIQFPAREDPMPAGDEAPATATPPPAAKPTPRAEPEEPHDADPDAATTTGRLLARKKKWKKDPE